MASGLKGLPAAPRPQAVASLGSPGRVRSVAFGVALSASLLATGCFGDFDPSLTTRCQTNADCVAGWRCDTALLRCVVETALADSDTSADVHVDVEEDSGQLDVAVVPTDVSEDVAVTFEDVSDNDVSVPADTGPDVTSACEPSCTEEGHVICIGLNSIAECVQGEGCLVLQPPAKCDFPVVCASCGVDHCAPANACLLGQACVPVGTVRSGGCATCGTEGRFTFAPDATACTDGDLCVISKCSAGQCEAVGPEECGDGNACTSETCVAHAGCVSEALTGTPCDVDGDACTPDLCDSGACEKSAPIVCPEADGNVCTVERCDPLTGLCGAAPELLSDSGCSDGDACTVGDKCKAGACVPGQPIACPSGPCVISSVCKEGQCDTALRPEGFDCSPEGDACTAGLCDAKGECDSGPLECVDTDPCTVDQCDPQSGCVFEPASPGSTCDDSDSCTGPDTCSGGLCSGPPAECCKTDGECDDLNPCTLDHCLNDHCANTAVKDGVACETGVCENAGACEAGACVGGGAPVKCADLGPCFGANQCSSVTGECEATPLAVGTPCSDGLYCTADDACDGGGGCTLGIPLEDGAPCPDCVGGVCGASSCPTDPANLAFGAVASASETDTGSPAHAVDNDLVTAGQAWAPPWDAPVGTWWQLDLGQLYPINRVQVFASPLSPQSWYSKFHIEGSASGAFTGEQTALATELDWNTSRGGAQSVTYAFDPSVIRYVRIVIGEVSPSRQLQEVRVYRATDFGDCDEDTSNGCETTLMTDADHCGRCGTPCPDGEGCINGACVRTELADTKPWGADAAVNAMVENNAVLYLGGNFTMVGPVTGLSATLRTADGTLANPAPGISSGVIYAAVSDGTGGYYAGGNFTTVAGLTRERLVHIKPDGTLDQSFNVRVDGTVDALALSADTLYVGGQFTVVGGQRRNRLAAVSATTGAVLPWDPNLNDSVAAIAVAGSTVYVGGNFTSVNGALTRNRLAAFPASGTASALPFNPNLDAKPGALIVLGNTLYAGGQFNTVGGVPRSKGAAFDLTSGALTLWNPTLDLQIMTFATSGNVIYAGGTFKKVKGVTRNKVAALDPTTGDALPWNPNVTSTGEVQCIAASDTTVYFGGTFTSVGNVPRLRLAAVSTAGVLSNTFSPPAGGPVKALAVLGGSGNIAVGGLFKVIAGSARNRLAAYDQTTKEFTSWNPDSNGEVDALAVSGARIYVGGAFTSLGGVTRNRAASLDMATGALTTWHPNLGGRVRALVISGGTTYLGGDFIAVNGTVKRNRLAAVSLENGAATSWDPNANNSVNAIAISGKWAYVGGAFTTINGGAGRNRLATVDLVSGAVGGWDPGVNGPVNTISVLGSTVYVGGDFTEVNSGLMRNRIAAVHTADPGVVTDWNPDANAAVNVIAPTVGGATAVFVGGDFTKIGGESRSYLAELDLTGASTSWLAKLNAAVRCIVSSESGVYVGGEFSNITLGHPFFTLFP